MNSATLYELKNFAKKNSIKGYSKLNKSDLIKLIKKHNKRGGSNKSLVKNVISINQNCPTCGNDNWRIDCVNEIFRCLTHGCQNFIVMNSSDKQKYCPKQAPSGPKLNPLPSPNNNKMNLLNLG